MSSLEKAIWVTGASSGIGKAIVVEFAKNDQYVIATSRRKALIESYRKELADKSNYIIPVKLDITDDDNVQEFYSIFSEKFFISTLVNNAGLTSFKSVENDSLKAIRNIIDVNLLGSIYAIKSVLPKMIEHKTGTIINILSVVTKKVFVNSSAYSASKQGLMAYANVLREENRDKNIKVINISPGATKTPIWPSDALEKYSHRMISPEDLAKFVYQIYTNKSNFVAEDIIIRPIQGDI